MITIISGTPGAGKTAYAVAQLLDMVDAAGRSGAGLRPLVVMGIPELTVPFDDPGPVSNWCELRPVPEDPTLTESMFRFPDGALVVVDEAQKVFRPRSAGSKVPDHVSALERHRHLGLDFWLITQYPNLLDSNVRALCGRHVHLRHLWSGRQLLEWPECANPADRSARAIAARQPYRLPARAFAAYKSASMHVPVRKRKPWQVYALGALLASAGLLGWKAYAGIRERLEPDGGPGTTQSAPAQSPALRAPAVAPRVLSPTSRRVIVGSTFVQVGERVLVDRVEVEDGEGRRVSVSGDHCVGRGRDAQCHVGGELVRWGGMSPAPANNQDRGKAAEVRGPRISPTPMIAARTE